MEIRRGLRVISLQTNQCYRFNWSVLSYKLKLIYSFIIMKRNKTLLFRWLFVNAVDPGNQLRWLIEQLQSAEDAGEKIHIIGHIPPGDQDCIKAWKYNFKKIVNRYYYNYYYCSCLGIRLQDVTTISYLGMKVQLLVSFMVILIMTHSKYTTMKLTQIGR